MHVVVELEQALCYHNLSSKFFELAAINVAGSFISLLACLLVTATIFLFKKYIVFNQRLVLYLSFTGVLNSFARITRGSAYYPINDSYSFTAYCAWSGFSVQVTNSMYYMALLMVFVDMYLRIVKQKDTNRYEILYILATFLLPVLVNWIPFTYSAYGQAGPWCWIKAINFDQNCTIYALGFSTRFVLLYVPVIVVYIIGIVLYILMVRHIYRDRFTSMYDPQAAMLRRAKLKEARPFLIYPWLFLALLLVSLVTRLVGYSSNPNIIIVFWALNALVSPIQGGVAALTFGLDLNTLRRLFHVNSYLCCQQDRVQEYNMKVPDRTDSFRSGSYHRYESLNV